MMRLLELWSSDNRTHIHPDRWNHVEKEIEDLQKSTNYNEYTDSKTETISNHKQKTLPENHKISLENKFFKCIFDGSRGATLSEFFDKKTNKKVFGLVPHGVVDDIDMAADFYSGHTRIDQGGMPIKTDLYPCKSVLKTNTEECILITNSFFDKIQFNTKYVIYEKKDELLVHKKVVTPNRILGSIRIYTITIDPQYFSFPDAYFETHNNKNTVEKFNLQNYNQPNFNHFERVSGLISYKANIKITKSYFCFGDNRNRLEISLDQSTSSPLLGCSWQKSSCGTNLFRIEFSVQETDDTFQKSDVEQIYEIKLKIKVSKK